MATYRAPRSRHRRRGQISESARRAMEAAALALTDAVPALTGEEALAERDRLRRQQIQTDNRQPCLPLGNPDDAAHQ